MRSQRRLQTKKVPIRPHPLSLSYEERGQKCMQLSVITVTTNTATYQRDILRQNLASVKSGAEGLEFEHFVSDNGSTDDTVAMIKKEFPNVKVIENGKNLGFGGANNTAFRQSTGEFVLFLNPDNVVRPGSLKILYEYMLAHPKVGIVGPKLVDQFGKLNQDALPRRFPKLLDQVCVLLKVGRILPACLKKYLYSDLDFNQKQAVDSVRGSFMSVRRALLNKLGWGFDPRYFIWFDDADLCREAWTNGYKVVYNPSVECIDYVGQTFRNIPSVQKQKWFTESMVKYFRKWEGWKWVIVAVLRPIAIFITWIFTKF